VDQPVRQLPKLGGDLHTPGELAASLGGTS
jgi:hypothetical protein